MAFNYNININNGNSLELNADKLGSDVTANITVPTKTSDITNDSGFVTNIISGMHRDDYYASNLCRHFSQNTPTEFIIKTKIKFRSSAYMPVIRVYGYAYGMQSPIELRIGFYVYNDTIGWCGVVCTGAWKPDVYLYKYTEDSVDYIVKGPDLSGVPSTVYDATNKIVLREGSVKLLK